MKKLAQGLISFLAMIALSIWTISAFTVPQPLENFYVADYANAINSQDADAIRTVNKNLEARNGSQIVVATFDFLDGEAIDDVAYDLFNGWKIGSASDNNGVLLVLAIGEEDYYCLQGKGLEKTLPTSDIQAILDSTLEPEFAAGNYSTGALKTVQALAQRLEKTAGTPVVNPSPSQGGGGGTPYSARPAFGLFTMIPSIFFMLFVFVIVVVILSVFTPRRRRYYGGPVFRPRPRRYYGPRPRPMDPWGPERRPREPRPTYRSHSSTRSSFGGGSASRSSGAGRSFGGGMNRGGGGASRGGGAGRRK